MHGAPSVNYPVGRCAFQARLYALAWLAGAAVCAAWTTTSAQPGWRQALAAFALVLAGAAAWAGWRRTAAGRLAWQDGAWSWLPDQGQAQSGRPEARLDLQRRMLLFWRGADAPAAWLWVERDAAPADWEALRRAVYSRANTEAPRGRQPPTASR